VHCVCRQTTRNIQDGLPFSIDDVRRQTEDPGLLAVVHDVADKYCRDRTEYNLLIVSVVVFSHSQRPSVAMNITIEEFVRAKTASDGRGIVLVSEHKTGAQGPAQIALATVLFDVRNISLNNFNSLQCHLFSCMSMRSQVRRWNYYYGQLCYSSCCVTGTLSYVALLNHADLRLLYHLILTLWLYFFVCHISNIR